jgi:serine phosphatase RsbU (regulator of sigma subunit)/anti-sigma regulatory factor (Ser/Thr protein kinase)/PAS domain-containing protein
MSQSDRFRGGEIGIAWTADAQGQLDTISQNWADAHGLPIQSGLGDGWLSCIRSDERKATEAFWLKSLAAGEPFDTRYHSRYADGSYHLQLTRAHPVRDESGTVARWVGVTVELEDESQEKEQQYIFKALAQHANDCVIIFSMDHKVRFSNIAARNLLKIPTDEAVAALRLIDIFVPDDQARVRTELIPEIMLASRWKGDFRVRNFHTDDAIPAHFDIFTIYNDQHYAIGIAVIIRDLLERLRYEQGFRMLAAAGAALLDTLDYRTILRNIARVVVNGFAPCCAIDEIDEQGNLQRLALAHVDPVRETVLEQASRGLTRLPAEHLIMRTLLRGEAQIEMHEQARTGMGFLGDAMAEAEAGQNFDSMISVPIVSAEGKVLAALTCGSSIDELGRRLNRDDLSFLQELSYRSTAAIENSRRYERERRIALTLQEAALPRGLRRQSGLRVSAEYRPGRSEATIGGDWYDTLALDDGRFLAIVGDVVGNGLRAAVAMSKLRQAMQTAALINPEPNFVLDAADQILRLHNENMYATALVTIYDPLTHTSTFASAGHPDPIIVNRDSGIRIVECRGMMIGLRATGAEQVTVTVRHDVGDMIVLFTDGIIEAERDAESGIARLLEMLYDDSVLLAKNTAEAIVNAILRGERATDDIAVLTLRIDAIKSRDSLRMSYNDVSLADEARPVFSQYLSDHATSDSDIMSAELVFGELLGNVLRHAPGPVDIEFSWENDQATLHMIDHGKGYSTQYASLPTEFAESQRGLFLIENFARSFKVSRIDDRTVSTVTFENLIMNA